VDDIKIEVHSDIPPTGIMVVTRNNDAQDNPPLPIVRGPVCLSDASPMGAELPQVIEAEAQEAASAPNVPAQPNRQRVRRERNVAFSTTPLADTIFGALIFSTIVIAMGEILKQTLPGS
jgi:hypothetical protein